MCMYRPETLQSLFGVLFIAACFTSTVSALLYVHVLYFPTCGAIICMCMYRHVHVHVYCMHICMYMYTCMLYMYIRVHCIYAVYDVHDV